MCFLSHLAASLICTKKKRLRKDNKFTVQRKLIFSAVFTDYESFILVYQKRRQLFQWSFSRYCAFKRFHSEINHLPTNLRKVILLNCVLGYT